MKIARLATTLVAGACLAAGGTVALVHPGGVAGTTLVSSSRPSSDSARDLSERGSDPSAAPTADPDHVATATPAPVVLAPTPTARPADDRDNDGAAGMPGATDVDEANEPADANEPAEATEPAEGNDVEHADAAPTPSATTDGNRGDGGDSGDGGGSGDGNGGGNGDN
jgi:hypothetical protein